MIDARFSRPLPRLAFCPPRAPCRGRRTGGNSAGAEETGPELRRGPYLQAQGPDRIVVRWRTDGSARNVRLRYGDRPDALDKLVPARLVTTPFAGVEDWAAVVDGLNHSQTYYYAVEASTAILAGADESPQLPHRSPRGQPTAIRFLLLGDCGTNRVDSGNPGKAVAARNGFRRFNGGRAIDGLLLLGDNAYSHGTDAQYQTALFSVYRDELARLPLWPCIGNHEITDDYFGIFTVPMNGEAGGVPSGKPKLLLVRLRQRPFRCPRPLESPVARAR